MGMDNCALYPTSTTFPIKHKNSSCHWSLVFILFSDFFFLGGGGGGGGLKTFFLTSAFENLPLKHLLIMKIYMNMLFN